LDLYKRFLLDDGIHRRYFAGTIRRVLLTESLDEKMKRFERWAVDLSVEASQKFLKKALPAPRY
jgi:predicted naringenin-chalcone synthase